MVNLFTQMQTLSNFKTSDKVKQAIENGYSKSKLAAKLGISRPTLYSRLDDNSWTFSEITTLKSLRIV